MQQVDEGPSETSITWITMHLDSKILQVCFNAIVKVCFGYTVAQCCRYCKMNCNENSVFTTCALEPITSLYL